MPDIGEAGKTTVYIRKKDPARDKDKLKPPRTSRSPPAARTSAARSATSRPPSASSARATAASTTSPARSPAARRSARSTASRPRSSAAACSSARASRSTRSSRSSRRATRRTTSTGCGSTSTRPDSAPRDEAATRTAAPARQGRRVRRKREERQERRRTQRLRRRAARRAARAREGARARRRARAAQGGGARDPHRHRRLDRRAHRRRPVPARLPLPQGAEGHELVLHARLGDDVRVPLAGRDRRLPGDVLPALGHPGLRVGPAHQQRRVPRPVRARHAQVGLVGDGHPGLPAHGQDLLLRRLQVPARAQLDHRRGAADPDDGDGRSPATCCRSTSARSGPRSSA